jgi:hypothetical protein
MWGRVIALSAASASRYTPRMTDDFEVEQAELVEACTALVASWERVSDWLADDLLRRGQEAPFLIQLARTPYAALLLSKALLAAERFRHRKLGAELLGFVRSEDAFCPELLMEYFERERARDRETAADDPRRLEFQSVVEDVVFAATRWTRALPGQRDAGIRLLDAVVESTLAGQYWNTATYALAVLLDQKTAHAPLLLERFAQFASGPPPVHPTTPTFRPERAFVAAVEVGSATLVGSSQAPSRATSTRSAARAARSSRRSSIGRSPWRGSSQTSTSSRGPLTLAGRLPAPGAG